MKCPNCRSIIEKKDLYCSSCGYYIPSYKQAKVHPYAKQSSLPFLSFFTGFISFLGAYLFSPYFFILAIIGFFVGFYSILKYRRGILGIVFNTFSLVLGVFLVFNPSLLSEEEKSKEYVDVLSFYSQINFAYGLANVSQEQLDNYSKTGFFNFHN